MGDASALPRGPQHVGIVRGRDLAAGQGVERSAGSGWIALQIACDIRDLATALDQVQRRRNSAPVTSSPRAALLEGSSMDLQSLAPRNRGHTTPTDPGWFSLSD